MSDNNVDLWTILEKDLEKRTGSLSKNVSYLEYFTDIIALILKDVINILPSESISPELQIKINVLNSILEHSSINLDSILNNPLELWKIQGIIDLKDINTELREVYMNALMSQGE